MSGYRLVRSERKSIALEVTSDGVLVVRAPHEAHDRVIRDLVRGKSAWIAKRTDEAKKRFSLFRPRRFEEGECLPYLGRDYPLHIAEDMFGKFLFEDRFILAARWKAKARGLFERWYKHEAFSVFTDRCRFYAARLGVRYGAIRLSGAKRRWGSCNTKGKLCFNWRLVMAPPDIIDYVVVHELAHLKEPNHSRRFWSLVESRLPGWRLARQWLKENQFRLHF